MLESLRTEFAVRSITAFESNRPIAGQFWWIAYRMVGGN